MKQGIHPDNYRPVVFKDISNGDTFISRSTINTKETIDIDGVTYPLVKLEISNTSHPFYTGKQKLVDTAGRVDKYENRYGNRKKDNFFSKAKHQYHSNNTEFGICDDPPPAEKPAYIDETDRTKWIAIVNNSKNKEITFTAIDHCSEYDFKKEDDKPDKRCDGVITFKKNVIFVELKERKGRKSKDWIDDGEEQLKRTIYHFSKTKDSVLFENKYAYIANSKKPVFYRGQDVRMNNFQKDTGYVLRIQNRIEID
ncbi:hypothetical protein FACS1894123_11270 [Bacteroidia bacterium]|nr:hypothetical protein FACS1894123_11270 [Bacteroidia bacterium]